MARWLLIQIFNFQGQHPFWLKASIGLWAPGPLVPPSTLIPCVKVMEQELWYLLQGRARRNRTEWWNWRESIETWRFNSRRINIDLKYFAKHSDELAEHLNIQTFKDLCLQMFEKHTKYNSVWETLFWRRNGRPYSLCLSRYDLQQI